MHPNLVSMKVLPSFFKSDPFPLVSQTPTICTTVFYQLPKGGATIFMKNEMDKTLTFSIREEERDRERRMLLRAVYDALSEKGYNPINQLVGYVLTEDPTYITNYKNARGMIRRIDCDELMAALLKEYLGL